MVSGNNSYKMKFQQDKGEKWEGKEIKRKMRGNELQEVGGVI